MYSFFSDPMLFGLDGGQLFVWPTVVLLFAFAVWIGTRDPHGRG